MKRKREALAVIADNKANVSEKQARKLMMMRKRERKKGNCIFIF